MNVGICCDVMSAAVAERAGADYFEPPVTTTLTPDKPQTPPILTEMKRVSLKPQAFNMFLPRTLKVTGPDVDMPAIEEYASRAFTRAAALGGKIIVFGSGAARTVPDGFPIGEAMGQMKDFLTMAARHAQAAGMVIAIEPLTKKECNIINTVSEAKELAADLQHPAISALADTYHMLEEGEKFDALRDAGSTLAHIHVAEPGDRKAPRRGEFDWKPVMRVLKESGYDARISIECIWTDFAAEAPDAVKVIKEAWDAV